MRNAICDVYPADEIPRTLRMCKGFIVNTDPHQKPGKHWIVFFLWTLSRRLFSLFETIHGNIS
jgi:hypothetical protein